MISEAFRIVAVDPLPPRLKDLFLQQLPPGDYQFQCPEGSQDSELTGLVRGAQALVTRHRMITAEVIATAGGTLRLLQVMGRLPDRIDLEAARAAGVPVAVMPHGGAIAVAEHTMALMLALARQLLDGHASVVSGRYRETGLKPTATSEWSFAFNWAGLRGVGELRGKILGLVGLGEIGCEVARRARAFDMTVVYNDLRRLPERYEQMLGAGMVPLDELLRRSDFVSLHLPHTAETEHLLNAERLLLMKPGAFLINVARGGLVDERALVESLRERRIAGAGLDVFALEPLPADHPLLALDNVVMTPHIGGGSGGGQRLLIQQVLGNIAAVAGGGQPQNRVE